MDYGDAIRELLTEGKTDEEIIQIMLKNQIPIGNTQYVLDKIREDKTRRYMNYKKIFFLAISAIAIGWGFALIGAIETTWMKTGMSITCLILTLAWVVVFINEVD
jgi:hypothetical protein